MAGRAGWKNAISSSAECGSEPSAVCRELDHLAVGRVAANRALDVLSFANIPIACASRQKCLVDPKELSACDDVRDPIAQRLRLKTTWSSRAATLISHGC